jgi:hypothetical protein
MITDFQVTKLVNNILEEIDKSMLLGAALDCMTESGVEKFKQKLEKLIKESLNG